MEIYKYEGKNLLEVKEKALTENIRNIDFVEGLAENLPFEDEPSILSLQDSLFIILQIAKNLLTK